MSKPSHMRDNCGVICPHRSPTSFLDGRHRSMRTLTTSRRIICELTNRSGNISKISLPMVCSYRLVFLVGINVEYLREVLDMDPAFGGPVSV
jgi:hypothetical protein